MKITRLEPSKHKAGRWLVWLEDGALLRVGENDVVAHALYAGKELDQAALDALSSDAEQGKVFSKAVEYLSHRPMSRKELLMRLTAPPRRRSRPGTACGTAAPEHRELELEHLRQLAEGAADRLEELGLLNDGEYARMVARHYTSKGYGPRKLRDELYRRGVPREYWDAALAEVQDGAEDTGRIDELLRKKLRGAEPSRENLQKASGYLARRGFAWPEISEALERYKTAFEHGEE